MNDSGTPAYDEGYKVDVIKRKKPSSSSCVEREKLDQYSKEVLIVIHTVNDNEKWAVVDCLDPPDLTDTQGKKLGKAVDLFEPNWIVVGKYGGYNAALIQTEMGNDAGPELSRAFEMLPNAKYIIALGVCYSATNKKGDVIVSKWIDGVSNFKFTGEKVIIARASNLRFSSVPQQLRNVFARGVDTWLADDDFVCNKEGRKPDVKVGSIISMPALIDSVEVRDEIHANNPEAIGGEMEGVKLLEETRQCNLSVIVIKGVADHADGSKDKVWQLTAALAAARYARHKLLETDGCLKC